MKYNLMMHIFVVFVWDVTQADTANGYVHISNYFVHHGSTCMKHHKRGMHDLQDSIIKLAKADMMSMQLNIVQMKIYFFSNR